MNNGLDLSKFCEVKGKHLIGVKFENHFREWTEPGDPLLKREVDGQTLTLTFEGGIEIAIPVALDKPNIMGVDKWLIQVNADGTLDPLPKLEPGSYALTRAFDRPFYTEEGNLTSACKKKPEAS
jgi:hypothetical protein